MIYYIYNIEDELIGFKYNNEVYYYIKNHLNDIVAITDSNYNIIVTYEYDSWGNILSIKDENNQDISNNNTHIGNINPYRYRSYYYDKETNLYYLNSRYYNPVWGRFINADNYVSTDTGPLGHNMYCYCNNNIINYEDSSGQILGLIAIGLGLMAYKLISKKKTPSKKKKAVQEIKELQNKKYDKEKSKKFKHTLTQNARDMQNATKNMGPAKKLLFFRNNVNNRKKYDLKEKAGWKGATIYYDGHIMEDQDIGNYNFGYMGRALGYDLNFLIAGAGANQLKNHGKKTVGNCFTTFLCDDPRDSYFIYLGAIAYDREHNS